MAEIVVFVGPTLPAAVVRDRLARWNVQVEPPVTQGDVARAVDVAARPRVVAIIDGGYERVPAVWHKEILYALELGIAVAGAASMGALRAAELAPYGMVGVGEVYAAVRDGELIDDDEVAVAHLGAEDGYRPVSEAMVTIRATVAAALACGALPTGAAAELVAAAKDLHYPDRRWPALLGLAPTAFTEWLRRGRRDVKAADATALLDLIATGGIAPPVAPVRVERTEHWRAARPVTAVDPTVLADLLDGLWLDGTYPDLARAATLRLITAAAATRAGTRPSGAALGDWVARLIERVPPADLSDLDDHGLRALAADQAALVQACAEVEDRLSAGIVDALRVRGQYAERLTRARAVAAGCDALGVVSEPAALGLSEADVWAWCAARAGLVPGTPPDAIADAVGAPDPHRLRRAALRHLTTELRGHR